MTATQSAMILRDLKRGKRITPRPNRELLQGLRRGSTARRAYLQVGDVIGRWTVVGRCPNGPRNQAIWSVRCECGAEKELATCTLQVSRSCGCYNREKATTHGMSGTPTYSSWGSMHSRCRNTSNSSYERYGGRGIRVCGRWESFESFLADMGERPSLGHSIERIDNNGNYEPDNCRWATATEQQNNTRYTVYITHAGRTQSVSQWSRETGIGHGTLLNRINSGWSPERALTVLPKYKKSPEYRLAR